MDFGRPFERLLVDLGVAVEAAGDQAELTINAVTWTYLHMRRSHRWSQRRAQEAVVTFAVTAVEGMTPGP